MQQRHLTLKKGWNLVTFHKTQSYINNTGTTTQWKTTFAPSQPASLQIVDRTATSITLSWKSVTDAPKYLVEYDFPDAKWVHRSGFASATAANTLVTHTLENLRADTEYTIKVTGENAFLSGVTGEITSRTLEGKYSVYATLSSSYQQVLIQENGIAIEPSAITINDTPLNKNDSFYEVTLPSPLNSGDFINLNIEVPEGTITAQERLYSLPAITAPTEGSTVFRESPTTINWDYSGLEPDRFEVIVGGSLYTSGNLPGNTRSFTIPALTFPEPNSYPIYVYAITDGTHSFTGLVKPDSFMLVQQIASVKVNVISEAEIPPAIP
jgi:Fibronectin type III domain